MTFSTEPPAEKTVTGGRNGISIQGGSGATLRNCTVHAGGTGIISGIGIVFRAANGAVDRCASTANPADGFLLEGSTATITNSDFSSNARAGIIMLNGSAARIGLTDLLAPAGKTIRNNGSNGAHVTLNSMAVFVGNTISGNGTNPAGPFGRVGIGVYHARVNVSGGSNSGAARGEGRPG
jgi:hypothetical protein